MIPVRLGRDVWAAASMLAGELFCWGGVQLGFELPPQMQRRLPALTHGW